MEFQAVHDGDVVVFDVETTGLDWRTQRPCGYVVTVKNDNNRLVSRYYPIRHETGPNLDPDKVVEWIKSWSGKHIRLVGHNLKFDLHFAANDGISFPNAKFECTQVNATLINEHLGWYSLDNLSRSYGVTAKKGEELYSHIAGMFGGEPNRNQMGSYWRLPADDKLAVEYAEGDGVSTWEVWLAQQSMIDLQELRTVWELECRVIPVLFKMERRGVNVDPVNFGRLQEWVGRQLVAAEHELPWEGFNVRSRKDLPKAFEDIGITDWPTTPKGNPSFVEKWLSTNELGRAILTVRKYSNLQNSFIQPLVDTHIHAGMVNCNFNQMYDGEFGTQTGRLSCNNPNMQQVPKRDKFLSPVFRSIFVPPAGCLWSQNDYSQQEYRVFAAYTGSQDLIKSYAEGLDMHQVVADLLDVERDPTAKRMNLGMLYGMGIAKLAASIDVDEDVAKNMRREYHQKVPAVKKFITACQHTMANRGYVKTIMGRRARLDDPNFAYRAASRVIQGTCADFTKLKMVEVNEFLEGETKGEGGVILQIHDELDWIIPEGMGDVDKEARRIMSDFSCYPQMTVDMKVDSVLAENWGRASFPEQGWGIYEQELQREDTPVEVDGGLEERRVSG